MIATLGDEVAHCDISMRKELAAMRKAFAELSSQTAITAATDASVMRDTLTEAEAELAELGEDNFNLAGKLAKAEGALKKHLKDTPIHTHACMHMHGMHTHTCTCMHIHAYRSAQEAPEGHARVSLQDGGDDARYGGRKEGQGGGGGQAAAADQHARG